jgi:hypothetical protein
MKEGEKNIVKVFPSEKSVASNTIISAGTELEGELIAEKAMSKAQQKFMGMVYARKKGKMKKGEASPEVEVAAKSMTKKEAKKFAKTKHKGLPEKVEEGVEGRTGGSAPNLPAGVVKFVDELPQRLQQTFGGAKTKPSKPQPQAQVKEAADCGCDDKGSDKEKERDTRGDYAKTNLIKNKLRAMGAKNPIVMIASEETVEEGMGLSVGASRLGAAILSNPRTPYEQGARNLQRNLTDPVGFALKDAIKSAANTLGAGSNTNDKMMQKRQPQTPLQKQVAARTQQVVNQSYEPEGEMVDEARAEEKRGLGSTGVQRQRQKKGVVTSSGEVAHPATSYSGGQNPQLRGKEGKTKEQRRAASRRYVDQPGGVYAKPENKQGEGRYAAKQAKKRPDLGSRFD